MTEEEQAVAWAAEAGEPYLEDFGPEQDYLWRKGEFSDGQWWAFGGDAPDVYPECKMCKGIIFF